MRRFTFVALLLVLILCLVAAPAWADSMSYDAVTLSGGFQAGHFPEKWDLTAGDLKLAFTYDGNGLADDAGAHAWAEFGIRACGYGDFNPTWDVAGGGVWLATDYEWTANTFDPDPIGSPTLDLDDKLILQRAGGHGEGDYDLPSTPTAPGNNHRVWWDRDGVDPWQNGATANTGGIYQIVITLRATSTSTGTAYLSIRGLEQGFETDGNWNTIELTPAGMTFTGNMWAMQVFYGLYGYGATHSVEFRDITVNGTLGDNATPAVTASIVPVPIGQAAVLNVTADDAASGGSSIEHIKYSLDSGVNWTGMMASDGAYDSAIESAAVTLGPYDEPGIHEVLVQSKDVACNATTETAYVVVYDPFGGFVTGGGWIDSPAGAYHPRNLPYLEGSYYEIVASDDPIDWFQARDAAEAMTLGGCTSAHLATITSQVEYDTVLELIGEYPAAWLGGFQDEGVYPADVGWQWVTGEPFEFEAWLPDEPNDSPFGVYGDAAEQQLEMYTIAGGDPRGAGWNDVPGDSLRHFFVVEYEGCESLAGKATFGFVSKYLKGARVPTGNTEFQFKAGDLNFKSTAYEWLVISGAQAQYKGVGTINGAGDYGFLLTATDGDLIGGADTFRIKIWDRSTDATVYDNGSDQQLGGGSIVIHKPPKR